MGFIPIIIALSGLVLLYSIFTYNQIKPRKAAINQLTNQMAEISNHRKQLILSYDKDNPGFGISPIAKELKKTSTDRFQTFKKENGLIQKINTAIHELDDPTVKNQLLELNQKQESHLKKLEVRAAQYNRFIKKAPTNIIASLFGFRPF